jgi:hypothetical protein
VDASSPLVGRIIKKKSYIKAETMIKPDNKKINIAICLSTEPRFWQTAADSISNFKNLNEQCQVDVFYHFWDDVTFKTSSLQKSSTIKGTDPATLQHHFKPTVGVCESKDTLDPHIDEAWEYIQLLKQKHNISDGNTAGILSRYTLEQLKTANMSIKEAFSASVKTTNNLPFSQIISMCKSLILMSDYAEKNNIYYDVVIRSRSDVYIKPTSYRKIQAILRRKKLSRYILFPSASLRSPYGKTPDYYTPYVLFDFFVSSSNIIKKDIFKDYTKKIIELMFLIKRSNKFLLRNPHNIVPLFLKQHRRILIGAPCNPFGYSLVSSDRKMLFGHGITRGELLTELQTNQSNIESHDWVYGRKKHQAEVPMPTLPSPGAPMLPILPTVPTATSSPTLPASGETVLPTPTLPAA